MNRHRLTAAIFASAMLSLRLAAAQPLAPESGQPAPSSAARALDAERRERLRGAAKRLAADIAKLGGRVSADVGVADEEAPLVEHDPTTAMNPASNAKLYTAAAALHELGRTHRFVTSLYGRIADAAVPVLVLRGHADPSLGMKDLRELAKALAERGIREVGSIAVDQSYLDDRFIPAGFEKKPGEWSPFRASVCAVPLDENTVTFHVRPSRAGQAATVTVEPVGAAEVVATPTTRKGGGRDALHIDLSVQDGRLLARLTGEVRQDSRGADVVRRAHDPRLLAGLGLRTALGELGIRAGKVELGGAGETELLATHASAPLVELVPALGKRSDNFYAETLFKAIAAERRAPPGSDENAASIVQEVLQGFGAMAPGMAVRNGSGLYDGAAMTTRATTRLLRGVYADASLRDDFVDSLSIGGVDGTLKSRFGAWAARRAIRAKTGTLDDVAALSGYILRPAGEAPFVFSVFVNQVAGKVPKARVAIDRFVQAVASEAWARTDGRQSADLPTRPSSPSSTNPPAP